ncbi:MAG: tRNA-specific 2-thiouridylase MnmA [Nitrospirales bacterium]|nr:MAG: tRNA-specific 2-thiouridylase MnmA [Nitrospirales bacterium]
MAVAEPKKVVLGMSGGVDSSVAAKLLKEQGHEVIGVTLKVWEEEDETTVSKRWEERGCCKVGMARHVAQLLGISHQVIDTRERFQKGVIEDFIGGYIEGTTPNPCVRCNERVKFGGLFHVADELGADYVATGHYANIRHDKGGTPFLVRGQDTKKDQSYFLYRIPPVWLSRMLFPLGDMEKPDVWREAEAMGLPVDELKESQEICFVTQGDYRQFLKQHAPQASSPGTFVDGKGRELGQHQGVAFYTPGQRKGLGISGGSRLYVQRVLPEMNMVVLGPAEDLDSRECLISDLNIFSPESLQHASRIDVKFRYSSPPVSATHQWAGSTSMTIMFDEPVRALSPGQSAVFYLGDRVLGGGIIQGTTTKNNIPICEETDSTARPQR